eukprot:GAFH01003863.1.p2 GENE.GAFH01003863.1~~GAFH01003863.1.p2  ORF type:complete len:276 (-),score=65.25 GAFH01003863.1:49-822(-)
MLSLYTSTPGGELHWSTSQTLNQLYGSTLRSSEVASLETRNIDGLVESIRLDIKVPLQPGEAITGVDFMTFFYFKLSSQVTVSTEAFVHVNAFYPMAGSNLTVMGDLILRQRDPLTLKTHSYDPLVQFSDLATLATVEPATLMAAYYQRDVRVELAEEDRHWRQGGLAGSAPTFGLTILVKVPKQRVEYVPGVLEVLKFSWVQYYCVGAIIWFFVGLFRDAVFEHQIVDTFVQDELAPDAALAGPPHAFNAFHMHQQ